MTQEYKSYADYISLYDGHLTIYIRKGSKKGLYSARLTFPSRKGSERVSLRTGDRNEAIYEGKRLYHEMRAKADRQLPLRGTSWQNLTSSFLDLRQKEDRHSMKEYTWVITNFLNPFFQDCEDVASLRAEDFAEYWDYRRKYWENHDSTPISRAAGREISNAKPYSHQAARREAVIIRSLLKYAHERGIISKIPRVLAPKQDIEKRGETSRGIFEDSKVYKQMLRALQTLQQKTPAPDKIRYDLMRKRRLARLRFWILLLSNTGIRVQEAKQLRHEQIVLKPDSRDSDLAFTIINLEKKQSKQQRGARQILSRDFHATYFYYLKYKKWLEDWNPALVQPQSLIFPSFRRHDVPFDQMSAMRYFLQEVDMHLDKKGNPRSSYSLRHFYCTQRLQENVPVHAVAWNVGTSYEQLYKTYSHLLTWNMRDYLTKNAKTQQFQRQRREDYEDMKELYGEEVDPMLLKKLFT